MFGSSLETYPAWFVFLGSILLFYVATEVGFRIGRYMRENREHIESGSTGLVTGSILGLVSFLLAFTFGMAASNYSERRGVVLDEANAIGTAYLRADLMGDDAQAARFRQLLFDYARTRTLGDESVMNVSDYVAVIRRSEAIQSQIWDMAAAEMRANPTPATALIVTAVNEVIDLHAVRVAVGMRHSIPDVIWWALYGISIISLTTTGYRFGASFKRRSELLPAMVVAFACILTLVADLNDPRRGFLVSDQRPLQDLLQTMQGGGT